MEMIFTLAHLLITFMQEINYSQEKLAARVAALSSMHLPSLLRDPSLSGNFSNINGCINNSKALCLTAKTELQ